MWKNHIIRLYVIFINNIQLLILEICKENNIKYTVISNGWVLVLEKDNKVRIIAGYKFDLNKNGTSNVFDDKFATYELLDYYKIPVIEQRLLYGSNNKEEYTSKYKSYEYLLKYFNKNKDIVIKRNDGTCGIDVFHITKKDELDELKELAQRKGIAQHVIFHKWVEYSDIPSYYAIGQYTLFFSKLPETFGLTLLNSAICGTPVISFGYGALPEIIPPGGLHKVVKEISEVPDIILKELDSARIESDIMFMKNNYLIEKVSEQYLQLFHELIKENGWLWILQRKLQ